MAYEYSDGPDFEREEDVKLVEAIFRGGSVEVLRRLVAAGANINARATYDSAETPLHLALLNGKRPEVIAELIKLGADVNAQTHESFSTPLHYAATAGEEWAAVYTRLLINAGADVHAVDLEGVAALSMTGSPAAARLLIAAGADVHARDKRGQTALHHIDDVEAAQVLVGAGADANAEDNEGRTPAETTFDPGVRSYLRRLRVGAAIAIVGDEVVRGAPGL